MKSFFRALSTIARRLQIIDGRVFFRSGLATSSWSKRLGVEIWPQARQPRAKVYLSALAWLRFRLNLGVEVEAVYVTPLHRFGNAVHQIGNAAMIANRIEAKTVVLDKNDIFRKSVWLGGSQELSFRLPKPRKRLSGQAVLVGRFFWGEEFPGVCRDEEIPSRLQGLRENVIDSEMVVESDPADLIIHLRGGDVFEEPPPKGYGQPPLSFYTFVISSKRWSKVVLVAEDRKNPVYSWLTKYLSNQRIPCEHVSGDLLSDLHVLVGAKNLVVASGSFGRAVIACSQEVRHVYEFEQTGVLYPLPPTVTHHRVTDALGEYRRTVLSRNWRNTDEQRLQMIQYPQSHMRFL